MSDELPQLPQRRVKVEHIQFDGDTLVAVVLEGEGIAVPVRLICEGLGLAVQPQSDRLREHDVLAQGLRVVRVPIEGRIRSVVAILHSYIAFWLATITPSQVRPEVRPKLVRYQTELVVILNALFGTDPAPTLPAPTDSPTSALERRLHEALMEVRLMREALLAAQRDTQAQVEALDTRLSTIEDVVQDLQQIAKISTAQAEYLNRAIKRLASRYQKRTGQEIYDRLFAQFRIDLGTPRYDALPAMKYDGAVTWLREQAARLLPDDPDALPPLQERLL